MKSATTSQSTLFFHLVISTEGVGASRHGQQKDSECLLHIHGNVLPSSLPAEVKAAHLEEGEVKQSDI